MPASEAGRGGAGAVCAAIEKGVLARCACASRSASESIVVWLDSSKSCSIGGGGAGGGGAAVVGAPTIGGGAATVGAPTIGGGAAAGKGVAGITGAAKIAVSSRIRSVTGATGGAAALQGVPIDGAAGRGSAGGGAAPAKGRTAPWALACSIRSAREIIAVALTSSASTLVFVGLAAGAAGATTGHSSGRPATSTPA